MEMRHAERQDRDGIRAVYASAFPESECEDVFRLAFKLLVEEKSVAPTISLVAENAGALIGHVAFSPVVVGSDSNKPGYILAPLAVRRDQQKRGVGSMLVEEGMQQLSDLSAQWLLVYGDPKYYTRFGFTAEVAEGFVPPYPLKWQESYFAVWQSWSLLTSHP